MEISGLDLVDITVAIKRRQGRYLALMLNELEELLQADAETYQLVRKLILDHFNDYTRAIFRILLGDEVEGLTFR